MTSRRDLEVYADDTQFVICIRQSTEGRRLNGFDFIFARIFVAHRYLYFLKQNFRSQTHPWRVARVFIVGYIAMRSVWMVLVLFILKLHLLLCILFVSALVSFDMKAVMSSTCSIAFIFVLICFHIIFWLVVTVSVDVYQWFCLLWCCITSCHLLI